MAPDCPSSPSVLMIIKHKAMMNHPLARFRYCPACGSSRWTVNNEKSKHCADCGFTYYANPSSATAAFILRQAPGGNGKELLVVRRAKEPAKGTLDLPGGFVDMDETAEQGMLREILEETGLQPDNCRYLFSLPNLYDYSGMTIHTIDMFYRCDVPADAQPHADDDADDCRWMAVETVCPDDFGLLSIRQAVRIFTSSAFFAE